MLSDEQRRAIRARLMEERARTVEAIRDLKRDLQEEAEPTTADDVISNHPADRGSDQQEEEMDVELLRIQDERLTLIDDALERLRTSPDDFDVSEVSGRRIAFERLELVPWTRVCTDEAS